MRFPAILSSITLFALATNGMKTPRASNLARTQIDARQDDVEHLAEDIEVLKNQIDTTTGVLFVEIAAVLATMFFGRAEGGPEAVARLEELKNTAAQLNSELAQFEQFFREREA